MNSNRNRTQAESPIGLTKNGRADGGVTIDGRTYDGPALQRLRDGGISEVRIDVNPSDLRSVGIQKLTTASKR
jgi:hypothetical protein